nr:MAG TPA: hypothetical protein [Caudoviricetes sp.]
MISRYRNSVRIWQESRSNAIFVAIYFQIVTFYKV